ncbi:hypothetical protein P3T35_001814 [Kitasatospora sp. GP30]|nr:hypothetical protein [Kitasatospora sp. GP30]
MLGPFTQPTARGAELSLLSTHRTLASAAVAAAALAISCGAATPSSAAGQVLWKPNTAVGPSSFPSLQ